MQRYVLRGRGNPAFARMEELLEVVHALGVVVEQLKRHPHRVAGVELTQIAHMHFGGEAGMLARLDVIEAAADELEGLVHRAVEQHIVIGHVEMAIVVDPPRLHPHQRGHEWSKEYGFEIATLEHEGSPVNLLRRLAASSPGPSG